MRPSPSPLLREGPCIVLRLRGEHGVTTLPALARQLNRAIAYRNPPWIIVDLSKVGSIDDHGINLLCEADERIRSNAGRLVLTGLRGRPLRHLRTCESLSAAIADLVDEGLGTLKR